MWSTESSITTTASKESVWQLWSEVSTWPQWDDGIKEVSLAGPFKTGTKGKLKPKDGPTVKFEITEATVNSSFSDTCKLPLARMQFTHRLSSTEDGQTRVTHRVEIAGPLSPLFGRVIGRGIAKDLPSTLKALAAQAEGLTKT